MHSSINKLRTQFDIYHKQLEEKELKMIQEMQILFDKEVRESGSTASSIERMRSLIGNIAEQTAPQHLGIVKSGHCLAESPYSNTVPKTQSVAEPRTDKIL